MQLFALKNREKIFIEDAEKGINYTCIECGSILKVRGGALRRDHFYHIAQHSSCRQAGKSERHLEIQKFIQSLLPENDSELEHIFFDILRIADVVWFSKKIVFEVQCSNISEFDAKSRTKDYESIGYEVIWLLDDKRYNRKKVGASESFLRSQHCYFISKSKWGIRFYDQYEIIRHHLRLRSGKPLYIFLNQIRFLKPYKMRIVKTPLIILNRLKHHRVFFRFDLLDLYFKNPQFIPRDKKRHKIRQAIQNIYLELLEYLMMKHID